MNRQADFVAVDLGASSGRVTLGRWDGNALSLQPIHRFSNKPVQMGDTLHWDAPCLWANILEGLARFRALQSGSPASISVDGWGVDFALLDEQGRLIGNPVCYRDPRTQGMPELVFAHIREEFLYQETGVQTMPINTLFQLHSMVRTCDPQLAMARTLLTLPDFFLYLLSGERSIEYSEATTTQMYSPAHGNWAKAILEELGLPFEILPPVISSNTVLGLARPGIISALGFPSPFPVVASASHDTACAVAAIPDLDRESVFLSSGTWSLMGVELDRPVTTERARALGLTNEGGAGGSTLLLRNLTGLWILQECLRQWEREGSPFTWDEIVLAAEQAEPSRTFLETNARVFAAPGNMPAAIRDFCRVTDQPVPKTPGEIARCTFESLSLGYRSVLESLEEVTGRRFEVIRIAGGGSQNRFLCQNIADVCERPVISGPVEASTLGNILLQAVAIGTFPDLQTARAAVTASIKTSRYNPAHHPHHARNYAFYTRLSRAWMRYGGSGNDPVRPA